MEQLASINPANEHVIGSVAKASREEYERLIARASAGFARWRTVPAPQRGEVVRQIGEVLREQKAELGKLISLETGKILQEGLGEVQEAIDIADLAVGQSRMLYGKTMHSERQQHRMYEQWHPYGPVGVITAFNFPVAVWAWNAFIAAICGNTLVWKPSPKAPLCGQAVQKICESVTQRLGYEGVFNLLITDDLELTETMVKDKRLPLISFTGSTHVGKHVGVKVAERMGRSLLELSGNNAVIVDETADLNLAVPSIVFGAVGTAGQRCTSTRRVFVQKTRYDELVQRLIKAYRQVKIGDPLQEGILLGPVIDAGARENFIHAIAELKSLGAQILHGGNALPGPGFYVEPTLVKAQNDWPVVQRETFAPILYVIAYNNLDDAIAMQNAVSQGLSSALFSQSLQHAEQFLSATGSDCGIANINIGTSGAEIGGAFGGEKDTGGGREAGSDSWKAYMRRQTNTINWGSALPLAQGIRFDVGD